MNGEGIRTFVLHEEVHAKVVVDLHALVRIFAASIVGNGLGSFIQLQFLNAALHEADAPSYEPVSRQPCTPTHPTSSPQCFHLLTNQKKRNSRLQIPKSPPTILHTPINIERNHIPLPFTPRHTLNLHNST